MKKLLVVVVKTMVFVPFFLASRGIIAADIKNNFNMTINTGVSLNMTINTGVRGKNHKMVYSGLIDFRFAAVKGDFKIVKNSIENGIVGVDVVDSNGWTVLHHASKEGHLDIVKHLLEKGAEIDKENDDGESPLIVAAMNGCDKIVEYLLGSGAEVNAMDNYGETALHWACRKGRSEVVACLIKNKMVDLDVRNIYKETALHLASRWGRRRIVKDLVKNGADLNAKDSYGKLACDVTESQEIKDYFSEAIASGESVINKGKEPICLGCQENEADEESVINKGKEPICLGCRWIAPVTWVAAGALVWFILQRWLWRPNIRISGKTQVQEQKS